jgi:alpha-L-fucosidase 2
MLNDAWNQVDGHLAGPAAIAEMLLQSHAGEIVLLPALPKSWPAGSVRGLRARGGATVDMRWSGSRLVSVSLGSVSPASVAPTRAGVTRRFRVRHGDLAVSIDLESNRSVTLDAQLRRLA